MEDGLRGVANRRSPYIINLPIPPASSGRDDDPSWNVFEVGVVGDQAGASLEGRGGDPQVVGGNGRALAGAGPVGVERAIPLAPAGGKG